MDPLEYLFSLERLGMKFGLEEHHHACARRSAIPNTRFKASSSPAPTARGR